MHFVCCSVSCQTMFRVVSDWLYSLGVIFGRDMNIIVLVFAKFFPIKHGTLFLFGNQGLLQHFMISVPSGSVLSLAVT